MNIHKLNEVYRLNEDLNRLKTGLNQIKNAKSLAPADLDGRRFSGRALVTFSPAIKILFIADYEAAIAQTERELVALGVSLDDLPEDQSN